MLETLTQKGISEITGIPQSTLSYVVNEQRELPTKYENTLYNAYRSTAYGRLKDSGLSTIEANRFKGGNVDRVRAAGRMFEEMVDFSTQSAVNLEKWRRGGIMTEAEQEDYAAYVHDSVVRGYQHSNEQSEYIKIYLERVGYVASDEVSEYF